MQLADGNLSLERLAQAIGIGPRSIQRQLSKHGTSYREVSTSARMTRAVELLMLKGNSVAGVSEVLGYEEPGNFSRAFAQYFGISPTKYIRVPPKIDH
jgi:AraC-like DNA-binding protein